MARAWLYMAPGGIYTHTTTINSQAGAIYGYIGATYSHKCAIIATLSTYIATHSPYIATQVPCIVIQVLYMAPQVIYTYLYIPIGHPKISLQRVLGRVHGNKGSNCFGFICMLQFISL